MQQLQKTGGWSTRSTLCFPPSHCGTRPLVPQSPKAREFFTIRGNNSAPPVSKNTRADIGDGSTVVPFASRAWVHRSKVGSQQGGPQPASGKDAGKCRAGKA